jgi:hypothetical protein
MECSICHEIVDPGKAEAHLTTVHPTPVGGFQFFYDGRPYLTARPSMLVSELLALVGGNVLYQFYEERPDTMPSVARSLFPISHAQAVDLTNGPRRFFSIPPATGN